MMSQFVGEARLTAFCQVWWSSQYSSHTHLPRFKTHPDFTQSEVAFHYV